MCSPWPIVIGRVMTPFARTDWLAKTIDRPCRPELTFIQSHFLEYFPHQHFYSAAIIDQYSFYQKCVDDGWNDNGIITIILHYIRVEGGKLYLLVFVFFSPLGWSFDYHYTLKMLLSFTLELCPLLSSLGYHVDNPVIDCLPNDFDPLTLASWCLSGCPGQTYSFNMPLLMWYSISSLSF